MILAGGGGESAAGCLGRADHSLAEILGAPLVSTTNGKGSLRRPPPERLPPPVPAKELLGRADTDPVRRHPGASTTGATRDPGGRRCAITMALNHDPRCLHPAPQLRRHRHRDGRAPALTGATQLASTPLWARSGPLWLTTPTPCEPGIAWDELADAGAPDLLRQRPFRAALPDDAVLVNELTQVGYVSRATPTTSAIPRSYVYPRLPGHPGLRLPHRHRRRGRQPRPTGGLDQRRRRLRLRPGRDVHRHEPRPAPRRGRLHATGRTATCSACTASSSTATTWAPS